MKKCILIILLFSSGASFAQTTNTFPTTGNVGVGIANPEAKLHIVGTEEGANGNAFIVGAANSSQLRLGVNTDYAWVQSHGGKPLRINELGNNALINPFYGRVGIGTLVPQAKLDVRGGLTKSEYGIIIPTLNIFSNDESSIGTGGAIAFGGKTGNANPEYTFAYLTGAKETIQNDNYAGYFAIHTVSGGENGEVMSANYERFRIGSNGNVGIGTTDPKGYKLAVAGNMIAESVKVKLQGTWPDYVFAKSFVLPTLLETETYIKEKGHLPGIPSAAEVKANGIDLGEMNAKLLQKIEELTVYLIEHNKRNGEIQDRLKDQERRNIKQEQKISVLEERLNKIEPLKYRNKRSNN